MGNRESKVQAQSDEWLLTQMGLLVNGRSGVRADEIVVENCEVIEGRSTSGRQTY